MADEADRAAPYVENAVSDGISEAARAVAEMPAGEPGECSGCGENFARLVGGCCGRCRDRFVRFVRFVK